MEEILVFSSHRKLLSGDGEDVTPFPEPEPETETEPEAGLVYQQQQQQHEARALIGPQKLRPIRCNGHRSDSSELGFLPSQQQQHNLALEDDTSGVDLVKIKSQMDANFISTVNSQFSNLPFSFSCSSDATGDSPTLNPNKRRKKLESFLQDFMAKVMEKQEQMHLQLMEMIHNKERQRIIREEAWRHQQMERAHNDQQMRSQEAARNLALLSFIHNALGAHPQTLQPFPLMLSPQLDTETDPNNKRWPTSEVQSLITLRTSLDHKFRTLGPKTSVWEQVSAGMANMGYNRSAKKCREKWENINKYFKKATGNGKKRAHKLNSCPYFNELQTLYKNQLISTSKANSPNDDNVGRQNGNE